MRIISGQYKGKKIIAPHNLPVRPTTDMAKEAIFNIFYNNFDIEQITVLDLFAGTGNISYEFASRGAKKVVSVDSNYKCYSFINKIISELKLNNIKCYKSDAYKFAEHLTDKFDIIFCDPPYDQEEIITIPKIVFNNSILNNNGWLIIEHSKHIDFSNHSYFVQTRRYGSVNFTIFVYN